MEIKYSRNFTKNYQKRIRSNKNLVRRFEERLEVFSGDQDAPQLKNHQLIGEKKNRWSFSITGNIRVIYSYASEIEILFLDIGTHNQVY